MRPFAVSLIGRHVFQLGGELYFVAVRVFDHEKQIVTDAMTSRPPPQRNFKITAMIRPVANRVPVRQFVRMVIGAGMLRAKHGETVVLGVGANECRGEIAVGINDAIR